MKPYHRLAVSIVGLLLGTATASVSAVEHHPAEHTDHAPAKLQLDHGKKWPTDEVLRQSMGSLRTLFAERIAAVEKNGLPNEEYKNLGTKVDAEVAVIIAQCKLDPKADAMLHIIVGELLSAAETLQGKTPGKPSAGVHEAVAALNSYGRFFDHPQWKPLK